MTPPSNKKLQRMLLGFVGLPILIACVVVAVVVWASPTRDGYEFKEPPVRYPLAKMSITQRAGKTEEVFTTLAPGLRLDDVVNLNLFEGFDPQMTAETAARRLGPPAGEWDDPFCRARTPFYDRPQGKVSICRYSTEAGGHRWDTVGYPRQCDHDYLFRDPQLPAQVVPWLPATEAISVHVRRQVGRGGVTIEMTRKGCVWVELSERD